MMIKFANGSSIGTPDEVFAEMVASYICGGKMSIGTRIPEDDYEIGQGKLMTCVEISGCLLELSFGA